MAVKSRGGYIVLNKRETQKWKQLEARGRAIRKQQDYWSRRWDEHGDDIERFKKKVGGDYFVLYDTWEEEFERRRKRVADILDRLYRSWKAYEVNGKATESDYKEHQRLSEEANKEVANLERWFKKK
jgi:hypothetical protein